MSGCKCCGRGFILVEDDPREMYCDEPGCPDAVRLRAQDARRPDCIPIPPETYRYLSRPPYPWRRNINEVGNRRMRRAEGEQPDGLRHRDPPVPGPATATPTPERNGPCPCGSGKKYKACCLNLTWERDYEKRTEARRASDEAVAFVEKRRAEVVAKFAEAGIVVPQRR